MAKNVKEMLAEANASVPKLSPTEAAEKLRSGDVLVVDVRDPSEVQQTGKLRGALNVSRGMIPKARITIRLFGRTRPSSCTVHQAGDLRWRGRFFRKWVTPRSSTSARSKSLLKRVLR
jgi:hypothetical protein